MAEVATRATSNNIFSNSPMSAIINGAFEKITMQLSHEEHGILGGSEISSPKDYFESRSVSYDDPEISLTGATISLEFTPKKVENTSCNAPAWDHLESTFVNVRAYDIQAGLSMSEKYAVNRNDEDGSRSIHIELVDLVARAQDVKDINVRIEFISDEIEGSKKPTGDWKPNTKVYVIEYAISPDAATRPTYKSVYHSEDSFRYHELGVFDYENNLETPIEEVTLKLNDAYKSIHKGREHPEAASKTNDLLLAQQVIIEIKNDENFFSTEHESGTFGAYLQNVAEHFIGKDQKRFVEFVRGDEGNPLDLISAFFGAKRTAKILLKDSPRSKVLEGAKT
jgi:hypothetical protein